MLTSVVQHRGFLSIAAAIILTGVTAAGAGVYWLRQKPDPQTAQRDQLLRYLVWNDVERESQDMQLALVDRFEREIRAGLPTGQAAGLSERYARRLAHNVNVLKRQWFRSRVGQYAATSAEEQATLMDRQIELVMAWSRVQASFNDGDTPSGSTTAFFQEIEHWMAEEDDTRLRDQMHAAIRDGILRWLATRDLHDQPQPVRRELAVRIADSLNNGFDIRTAGQANDDGDLLRANAELLMEAWMHDRAEQFAQLPPADRTAFVDDQIANVSQWGLLEWMSAGGDSAAASGSMAAMIDLQKRVQKWIDRADGPNQEQLRQLMNAVQARIIARSLQQLFSSPRG